MDYGKKSTQESWFNGQLKSKKVEYSIPEVVKDKGQVMTEVIKALELITNQKTTEITLKVVADPKTHNFKLITKSYVVEEKNVV